MRSRRPPPVTSSFILLILILLGMQIRGWSHTPVSGIKTEAGHLTHQDGGKHVFYPTCLFHYQYPALGLHASWCHSDSELIIYWCLATSQWEASAPGLDQSEGSWIWSSGLSLIWITEPGSAGGARGGGRPIAGPAHIRLRSERSCKHVSLGTKSSTLLIRPCVLIPI